MKSFFSALPLASCTHWHFFNCIVVTEQAFLSKRTDTTHKSGNEDRSERDGSEMTPERQAERAQMRLFAHEGERGVRWPARGLLRGSEETEPKSGTPEE